MKRWLWIVAFLCFAPQARAGDALQVQFQGKNYSLKPGENFLKISPSESGDATGELRIGDGSRARTVSAQALRDSRYPEEASVTWAVIGEEGAPQSHIPVVFDAPRSLVYLGVWNMLGDRVHLFNLVAVSLQDQGVKQLFTRQFGGLLPQFQVSKDLSFAGIEFRQGGDWGIPGTLAFVDLQGKQAPFILSRDATPAASERAPKGLDQALARFLRGFPDISKSPAGHPYGPDWSLVKFIGPSSAEVCLTASHYATCESSKPEYNRTKEECYRIDLLQGSLQFLRGGEKKTKEKCGT